MAGTNEARFGIGTVSPIVTIVGICVSTFINIVISSAICVHDDTSVAVATVTTIVISTAGVVGTWNWVSVTLVDIGTSVTVIDIITIRFSHSALSAQLSLPAAHSSASTQAPLSVPFSVSSGHLHVASVTPLTYFAVP